MGGGRAGSEAGSRPLPASSPLTAPLPPCPHPVCSPAVPTIPPGNVHAEATNSTAIRFTWTAPSPQFINGINQGYKVGEACPQPKKKPGDSPGEAPGWGGGARRERGQKRAPHSVSEIIGPSQ